VGRGRVFFFFFFLQQPAAPQVFRWVQRAVSVRPTGTRRGHRIGCELSSWLGERPERAARTTQVHVSRNSFRLRVPAFRGRWCFDSVPPGLLEPSSSRPKLEPDLPVGSVVTLTKQLGQRPWNRAGLTQIRKSRNPTGRQIPPFSVWSIDWLCLL
jgi:hypothetical protein